MRWLKYIATGALVLVLALVAYNQYNDKMFYYKYLDGQYQKSFYELVDHVQNVQTNLAKLKVAQSPTQNVNLLSDVWRQAYAAQNNISSLPIDTLGVMKINKYLNQVADYSYSLSKKQAAGTELSKEDISNLKKLQSNAKSLTQDLDKLRNDVATNALSVSSLRSRGGTNLADNATKDILSANIGSVEKQAMNTPKLIYDGPFSSDLESPKTKGLTGINVSEATAKKAAIDFLGMNLKSLNSISASNALFPAYGFMGARDNNASNNIYMSVSKKGAHVIWMMDQRPINSTKLTVSQAKRYADKYLGDKGFNNMTLSYYEKVDNSAIFNYIYEQNGVIVYPDLVKIKVALDNGQVVAFDAKGYYTNHVTRDIKAPKLTLAEARTKVSKNMSIQSQKLALIPLENKVEVLAYEYKGTSDGDTFYVYIDADTGKEIRVMQVIKTYKGNLTM